MPDVGQTGQVVGDGHPAPGLVPVHAGVEATQTSEQNVTLKQTFHEGRITCRKLEREVREEVLRSS